MSINITGNAPAAESQAYVDYLESKYNRKLKSLDIKIDGDFADLNYEFEHVPFERIRRITGYLVGTMDQWNSCKITFHSHMRQRMQICTKRKPQAFD